MPADGTSDVFVPPHVRVLHVAQQPLIISEIGLFGNLCFGGGDEADENCSRVLRICKRLGISDIVLKLIENDANSAAERQRAGEEKGLLGGSAAMGQAGTKKGVVSVHDDKIHQREQEASLSMSDQTLLHIARALVMNPEVLVIHKPTAAFDENQADLIVQILREFVDNRGFEEPLETKNSRSPRTCIFSVSQLLKTHGVDMVLNVTNGMLEKVDGEAYVEFHEMCWNLFDALDTDQDQRVTRQEFMVGIRWQPDGLRLLGVTEEDMKQPPDKVNAMLGAFFDEWDCTNNGDVDFDECLKAMHSHSASFEQTRQAQKRAIEPKQTLLSVEDACATSPEIPFEPQAPRLTSCR